ncbi:MAG: GNAT family N-acetyltransferase [Myxococcus sp.]|nr:GNAT family N-acetyltransferase [Myxococcus sp.]
MQLIEATDAEKLERDVLAASAWGRNLSTAQFLAREAALRAHPFARTAMRTWLWRDDEVRSSCETFEVAARRGAHTGRAFIVASVFTEPAFRGRGHAVAMLSALGARLARDGALAVALFSEVRPTLYERCGFVAQPGFDVTFPSRAATPGVQWSDGLEAPPLRGDATALTLELSSAQCAWHLERERFYATTLGRPAPTVHLARRGDSRLAVAASFQRNELHVLWYDFREAADAVALLEACAALARACALPTVRVAEVTTLPLPSGARRVPRSDELPMVRALDGGAALWADIHQGLWA